MHYNFEWHPKKAQQNIRKHKMSFERASTIFQDQFAISLFDDEHNEERWITIGQDSHGILLVISHTFRETDNSQRYIRIISARKATKREAAQYKV
ncbi:MAG: BrnT family toxin [Gammaproteobacteria bacterium]|nr:MAG: BrnT family toxin [Gammaproteobacteria bacterium]RKZ40634.1 MAG: BrnT family toxin [Gammaproteobacteria bacterium]